MTDDLISLQEKMLALAQRLEQMADLGQEDPEEVAEIRAELLRLGRQTEAFLADSTPPEVEEEMEALPLGFEFATLLRVRLGLMLPVALYSGLRDDAFTRAMRGLSWLPFAPWVVALGKRLNALEPDTDTLFTTAELLALEQGMHVVALAAVHGVFAKLGWDAPDAPMTDEDGHLRHELEFALARTISDATTRYLGENHPARLQAAREIAAFAARVADL